MKRYCERTRQYPMDIMLMYSLEAQELQRNACVPSKKGHSAGVEAGTVGERVQWARGYSGRKGAVGERVPSEGAVSAAGHNHVSQRGHSQAPHRALVRLQAQQLRGAHDRQHRRGRARLARRTRQTRWLGSLIQHSRGDAMMSVRKTANQS